MLIRSKIQNEPKGRRVDIGGVDYHFAPNARGDNVCDVTDKAHIQRFLSIVDGYEIYDPDAQPSQPVAQPEAPVQAGDPFAAPVTELTDDEPVPTEEEMNASERKGADYNGMTRRQLEAAYEKKFGKRPHPAAKDDTILAKLTGQ